jgi:ubiquinone/menaquinone biosynthesis C-methylase UbiE
VSTNDVQEMAGNQLMVPVARAVCAAHGMAIPNGARVLDFGCGGGRHVDEFAAAGFDAHGVDRPVDALIAAWRDRPDAGWRFAPSSPSGDLPHPDDSFDFCYSTSVLEHVMDYERPLAEIVRVLKPGSPTLHVFPARWRPVEPHIFTPLGGRFQQRPLLWAWAALGIRNAHQQGMSVAETAERNYQYSRTGINYPTKREIEAVFKRHFTDVQFVEREFIAATREVSTVSRILHNLQDAPGVEAVYRGFHTRVILARA